MELKKAILVLADISGYTRFLQLHTMSLLHAEKIITELIESIVHTTGEPLRLNKLEGDAIFFYAELGEAESETASRVFQQTQAFFKAFSKRSKELTGCNNLCPCDACRDADQLRLKTIIHTGDVAFKKVLNFEELAGESVILTHRLIKNSIPVNDYILVTDEFAKLCACWDEQQTESRVEDCEGIGQIPVEVYYPEERSTDGQEGRRLAASIANAARLDAYSFARVLRLKKVPDGATDRLGNRGGLLSFISDGLRGLGMLVRKK